MSQLHVQPSPRFGELWEVSIDGVVRWPSAKPFQADSTPIILAECLECFHCGSPNTIVRRAGGHIVWLARQEDMHTELEGGESICFDLVQYQAALASGDCARLPELTPKELRTEIQSQPFPDYHDALYTIPDLPGDPSGAAWLRLLQQAIESLDGTARFVAAPATFVTVHVGLELPGVPAAICNLGRSGEGLAILLAERPRFPIWLTSQGIDEIVAGTADQLLSP